VLHQLSDLHTLLQVLRWQKCTRYREVGILVFSLFQVSGIVQVIRCASIFRHQSELCSSAIQVFRFVLLIRCVLCFQTRLLMIWQNKRKVINMLNVLFFSFYKQGIVIKSIVYAHA
jgi:hypothetical protein